MPWKRPNSVCLLTWLVGGLMVGVCGCRTTSPIKTEPVTAEDHRLMATLPEGHAGVHFEFIDADTGRTVPARVRIRDAAGNDHVPEGAVMVPIAKDRWFASPGSLHMALPAGEYKVRVERGTEYRPLNSSFPILLTSGRYYHERFKLDRWIDMKRLGYTSGENHLHIKPGPLAAMLAAEDLDFGTSLTWWNGQRVDIPRGRGYIQNLSFDGVVTPTSIYDAEIEHAWGAVYIVGRKTPAPKDKDGDAANLPIVRDSHEQGALVCYQGGWSREVLVDALLGYVDVVNICNNNFHRHMYQPRKIYSNLLKVEGFPEYPDTEEDMIRMNEETYYRLLNCGLKLAAGAGSATGAKTTPVGYNRAYVRAGEHPTLPEFLEAWRQGRNFVTNGPMIMMKTSEGRQPGDEIAFGEQGGHIDLHVRVESDHDLQSVEIVRNGEVIHTQGPPERGCRKQMNIRHQIDVEEGSWIAARCRAVDQLLSDEELSQYQSGGRRPQKPSRLRFAHTSPIYVTVGGQGPRVEKSLDEAARMLDAFERFARTQTSGMHLDEILKDTVEARIRLSGLAAGS